MNLIVRQVSGIEYLDMVTHLLQQIRLASAEAGVWEAADLQWAWRKDQHPDPSMGTFWIDGSERVVGGYRLRSRAETPDRPHHMIKRSGDHVAQRLRECSLYEPSLDLFVEAPDGSVTSGFQPSASAGTYRRVAVARNES
jgi:hypothetical protein